MATHHVPYCLAMIVAEKVIVDHYTKQSYIMGTFKELSPHSYPFSIQHMALYTAFTDVRAGTPIRIRLISDDETLTIFDSDEQKPIVLVQNDPLDITEVVLRMDSTTFPAAGIYRYEMTSNGTPIMDRKIIAR